MTTKTLEQLRNHMYQWVALSEPDEKIVGSGSDVVAAQAEAEKRGYKGEITFFKVLPFGRYVPIA
jgi:hypothetical protein